MAKKQKFQDPEEDTRIKGTWWSYWNKKTRQYEGPDVRGSMLCYSTWTHVPKKQRKKTSDIAKEMVTA